MPCQTSGMTKTEALQVFKTQAALARALGIGRASVHAWGDDIPLDRQCQIEIITRGALKADRDQLFPADTKQVA
jgi:hypothetical protein